MNIDRIIAFMIVENDKEGLWKTKSKDHNIRVQEVKDTINSWDNVTLIEMLEMVSKYQSRLI